MTANTQTLAVLSSGIPTSARGAVRAFIKGHKDFARWIASKGIASREAKNSDLLDFATEYGLLEQVQALIDGAPAPTVHAGPAAKTETATDREIDDMVEAVLDDANDAQGFAKAKAPDNFGVPPKALAKQFDMRSLFEGVEQLLSPLVRVEMEKVLKPVLDAANKPAEVREVVKEVVKTVTIEAPREAPKGQAPYAVKTGKTIEFGKLFGCRGQGAFLKAPISLWNADGQAPSIDPFYVVDPVNMGLIATAAETGMNVWQVGPSGSGKTTNPEQFAAHTGRPFVKIAFTRQTEVADMIGGDAAAEGKTFWKDGALIAAMRRPGTVILLDEPTIAPPGVQAIIQAVTDDHRSYTIHSTGEVVRAAPGVFFVVADNTNGAGDETGQYAGTHQANAALVNRFKVMVRVDYMSKQQEAKALVNHTGIDVAAAEYVVDFFARARKLPDMEGAVLSLRQMTGFVNTVKNGFPAKIAFETALLSRLPGTERAALETLVTLDWQNDFEVLMGVKAKPVDGGANAPSNSMAGNAFDDEVSASLSR